MLYEYPDEFIVPVSYTDDFRKKSMEYDRQEEKNLTNYNRNSNIMKKYKGEKTKKKYNNRKLQSQAEDNYLFSKINMENSFNRNDKDMFSLSVLEEFIQSGWINHEEATNNLIYANMFKSIDDEYAMSEIKQ